MSKRQPTRRPTRHSLRSRSRQRGWIVGCLSVCGFAAVPAQACCLTDWLYGRTPAYAAAPVTPYAAAYAPAAPASPAYTAGYAPVVAPAAGIAPHSRVLPLAGNGIYSPNPAYSVQRPAYGQATVPAVPLNNPSVYTGQPVSLGYRGLATPSNPFYGTGNIYPNNYASASPTPVTSYRPVAPAGYAAAMPAAAPVAAEREFATPIRSGLARFFSSLLGTGYRSSYYTAPVTYYRPATTLDPVSGTTVTVQQPCTSTVQQLQRTPVTSFQPAPAPAMPSFPATSYPSDCGVASGTSGVTYGNVTTIPTSPSGSVYPGLSGASGTSSTWNSGVQQTGDAQPVPTPTLPPTASYSVPSYSTPPSYASPTTDGAGTVVEEYSPNTSPLTGVPSRPDSPAWEDRESYGNGSNRGSNGPASSLDRVPLEPPRLESERPRVEYRSKPSRDEREQDPQREQRRQAERDQPRWQSEPQRSDDSSGNGYYQRSREEAERDRRDLRDLTTQRRGGTDPDWPRVRPIPAPQDYRNPFEASRPADRESGTTNRSRPADSFAEVPQQSAIEREDRLEAPELLPPLPAPSQRQPAGWNSAAGQASERRLESSLGVPIREASIQGGRDRVPSQRERHEVSRDWQPVETPDRITVRRQSKPMKRPEPTKTVWYSTK